MASVWAELETEGVVSRAQQEQKLHRLSSGSDNRKRSRSSDVNLQRRYSGSASLVCDPGDGHRAAVATAKKSPSSAMAYKLGLQGLERNISSEVSALRSAAAKAVAEFNEPLGAQLTDPDKSDEMETTPPVLGKKPADLPQNNIVPRLSARATDDSVSLASLKDNSIFTQHGCPPHGAKAIMGRRPRMEDAFTAVPFLLEVPVPGETGTQQSEIVPERIKNNHNRPGEEGTGSDQGASSQTHVSLAQTSTESDPSSEGRPESPPYLETLHFFGVFDGHGGAEAALHCAQTLHQRIVEALSVEMDPAAPSDDSTRGNSSEAATQPVPQNEQGGDSGMVAADGSVEMDQGPNSEGNKSVGGTTCNSASFESALQSAFNKTDEEFGLFDASALVGTTAVVTLVGSRQLYIANCGDSRAVLCRAGIALPLTDDHKANREDESARVEALGGQILFWNGVRVMGVLAVSRSIGDHCMRPFVIPEPEVTILARRPDDELLLLASDGLWDVLSNQMACTLAKRCLRRARQRGASRQAAARIAATVLTRAAYDRGSRDNVTVLVIDLSTGSTDCDEPDVARTASMVLAETAADHTHDHDPDERLARMQSMQAPRAS